MYKPRLFCLHELFMNLRRKSQVPLPWCSYKTSTSDLSWSTDDTCKCHKVSPKLCFSSWKKNFVNCNPKIWVCVLFILCLEVSAVFFMTRKWLMLVNPQRNKARDLKPSLLCQQNENWSFEEERSFPARVEKSW